MPFYRLTPPEKDHGAIHCEPDSSVGGLFAKA
jgi:hypothetical protein